MSQEQEQKILQMYEKYTEVLLSCVDESQVEKWKLLLSDLEARICTCPLSSSEEYAGCTPGGLVDHSLIVAKYMRRFLKATQEVSDYDESEAVLLALIHDLGKIGTKEHERFIPNQDEFRRRKGWLYAYNPDLPDVTAGMATISLLMEYGISLPEKICLAILRFDPSMKAENIYRMSSILWNLQHAKACATAQMKTPK